jgi:hypothetical protein
MTDRPDWGWGSNPPVFTFTEDEIRAVAEGPSLRLARVVRGLDR